MNMYKAGTEGVPAPLWCHFCPSPPIVISLSLLRQTRQETVNGEIHRLLSREIDGLINSFIRLFVRSFVSPAFRSSAPCQALPSALEGR